MPEAAPAAPAAPQLGVVAPSENLADEVQNQAPTSEPAPEGDPTGGDPGGQPETDPQQPPRGKNWAARKIDQLTRQAAEERAERLRVLGLLERAGINPAAPPQPQAPADDGAPKREQFDDYESYLDARAEWRAQRAAGEVLQRGIQQAQQHQRRVLAEQEAAGVVQQMHERIDQGRQRMPDFDAVVSEAADLPVGLAGPAIATSDDPAGVIYYLAKHPEEAQKIARLNETQAARAIGRIEASITAAPPISNAPPPGKPVGARPAPSGGFREDMTMEEFVKWRKTGKG